VANPRVRINSTAQANSTGRDPRLFTTTRQDEGPCRSPPRANDVGANGVPDRTSGGVLPDLEKQVVPIDQSDPSAVQIEVPNKSGYASHSN